MKKTTSFLGMLLVCVWFPSSILAMDYCTQSVATISESTKPSPKKLQESPNLRLSESGKFIKVEASTTVKKVRSRTASVSSASELSGNYVQTYQTIVIPGADGGRSVTIETVDGNPNSIKFINFYDTGVTVTATVDFAAKTISIPNQQIIETQTLGKLDIAVVEVGNDGLPKPNRTKEIEGTINDDGSISITSWWGIFQESSNSYVGCFYQTEFQKANATMSQTRLVTTTSPFTEEELSYSVIAEQTSPNILTVINFGNYGMTVELELRRDQTAAIGQQLARKANNGDNYYTNAITYDASTGRITGYADAIATEKATDKRNITWKDWTMTNSSSYLAIITEGKLTVPFDISYPTISVSDFEGEGTENSPYLIKSIDHLILLGDKVNDVKEADYNSTDADGKKYNRAFTGKYFRLENDIDMAGYRFTPIGKDWSHHFDGTFDGNNHTIQGLNVSTGGAGYAALFGHAGEASVIKNLNAENPVIRASNYYAAAIVGWSDGIVDKCHVSGADVENSGRATAGLAGVVKTITNCSVTNSNIIGLTGNVAGLASEVDELIQNCNATETNVIVYSSGELNYPAGGLTALLYYAKAENCFFSGIVDCQSLNAKAVYAGGITGNCYQGIITKCFSVGTILGCNDINTVVGGIVGFLTGELNDSYSIGSIQAKASKRVGGLTGFVSSYTDEEKAQKQSVVTGCYTSTQIFADTYLYNPETESRETLGMIQDGSTPAIDNIYFDKQISNFGSKYAKISGVETADLTKVSGITGLNAAVWSFTEGQYPRLKGLDDNETAKMGASVISMASGNSLGKISKDAMLKPLGNTQYSLYKDKGYGTEGYFCSITDSKIKIEESFGTDTLVIKNGNVNFAYFIKIVPVPFEGDGTELSPFLLKTKEDLVELGNITNAKMQPFADTYFKLANDIDMEYTTEFDGISSVYNDSECQFSGTIDGDGHTISRMLIDRVLWKIRPEDTEDGLGTPDNMNSRSNGGFIGRLAVDGVIKNITFAADCKFEFWATSGTFAGDNYGLINNCKNYADVRGYSNNIGGFVGTVRKDGKVTNCYNAGNIYCGANQVGGITGINYGFVENCANAGNVEVKQISMFQKLQKMSKTAGGITGSSTGGVIRNCVNAGTVYSWGERAGGIAGLYSKVIMTDVSGHNDMYNSINFGSVSADGEDKNTISAIAGEGGTQGIIQNNYWDAQILTLGAIGNADMEGMNGVETPVLVSGTALEGFDTSIWDFTKGQYPVLKQFANEDKLSKARKVIVTMKPGVTAKDMNQNAKLTLIDGLTWSLEKHKEFAIGGSTLYSPEEVDELTIDNLVADFGDYVKKIEIKRIPAVPLAGSGTEEDPYLISSTTDWNNLSDYIDVITESFQGKFLKLTENLDFTDTEFKMLAAKGVTPLQASLDGNNKKISGINLTTTATGQAAIRTLGESGSISNLTITGEVTSNYASTGGFTGSVYGKLINCVSEINVTSSKDKSTSGFGKLYAGAILTDVVNKGTISGTNNDIAGIAAEAEEGVELVRCGNEGKIICNGNQKSYIAGLIAESGPITMEECYNKGNIEIIDIDNTKYVAGLIAYAKSTSSRKQTMTLTGCYNEGDIVGSAVVAGLIANTDASGTVTNPLILTECYNTGNITASPTKTQSSTGAPTAGLVALYTPGSKFTNCRNSGTISTTNINTGGITAYYKTTPKEDNPVVISNCHNTGTIESDGNNIGGIIAYSTDYTTTENCYNTAELKGSFGIGGIAGYINGVTSTLKSCWNSGKVTIATNRGGGLVGLGSKGVVESSFNVGDVISLSTEVGTDKTSGYGIGGLAGQGTAVFTDCYNMGIVTGANQVGGLVGVPRSGHTQIIRCYNAGKIVAQSDECGSLIGADLSDSYWNSENKVESSYFVTDYGTHHNDTIGTTITIAELAKTDMGNGWTAGDDYTLPIPTTQISEPYALINAVTIAFAEGDSKNSITKDFFVGAPEGVNWTSSVANISFSGFNALFDDKECIGKATLTATAGELNKTFEINCNKPSGINDILNGKIVVKEVYYNTYGIEVPKPTSHDSNVYMVVRTYDDGTTDTLKFFNVK